MNWLEKTKLKTFIKMMNNRKKALLKRNTEKAILKAKQSIILSLELLEIKGDEGELLTPKDVKKLNEEKTIELFEEVTEMLTKLYINERKKK